MKPGNLWQCWDDGIGIICLLPSKQRAFSWVCRLEGIQTCAVSAVRKFRDYPVGTTILGFTLICRKGCFRCQPLALYINYILKTKGLCVVFNYMLSFSCYIEPYDILCPVASPSRGFLVGVQRELLSITHSDKALCLFSSERDSPQFSIFLL